MPVRIVRFIRSTFPGALMLCAAAALLAAEPAWRDATRDVYIDGELDRAAKVFVNGAADRTAIVSPRMDDAFVLDRETGSVWAVARRAFRVAADRATAELDPAAPLQPSGRFQKVDSVASTFSASGHVFLAARHQGVSGEIDEARLWETVPVWKSLADAYSPDAAVVAALRKVDRPAKLTLVFGTWCGDSKEFVPRLLKALRAAGNPNLSTRLVALDLDFRRPADVIQGRRIINVPTVLVDLPDGREIGRYTETPAGDTVEGDVLAILNGAPRPHNGRYDRGPEIARGTYLYRDGAGEHGREVWTLYAGKDGGRLIHSRIESGDLVTEVFQGTKSDGRLDFAEITRRQGEGVMRARFRLDGDTLTGSLRGREAGILRQDLIVPPSFAFASPAIAAAGWGSGGGPAGDGPASDVVCYVAPESFAAPLGSTCTVTYRVAGQEPVKVPAGDFRATHVARQSGGEFSDWWLLPDLGVPVRGQVLGGMEYVLSSLEMKGS